MNREVNTSIISKGGTRSGSSYTKILNMKALQDKTISIEYIYWKLSVELKINVEELGLVALKVSIIISVLGEGSKNTLIIISQILAKTYIELTKEDLFVALNNRLSNPFKKGNMR